jgi:DNA-binding PadR family transcriptional regulator
MAIQTRDRDPVALLPLKPTELLILAMLSARDRHGYGIRDDIIEHTGGRMALEAGNLYRHIRNLEDAQMLEETAHKTGAVGDEERRIYYHLLPFGRRVLAAELHRLRELTRFAEAHGVALPRRS